MMGQILQSDGTKTAGMLFDIRLLYTLHALLLPSTEGGVGGSQDVGLLEVAQILPLEL